MLNFWEINLHIYGLVLGLGILMAREVAAKVSKERKFDEKLLDKVFFVSLVGGIIGARIYHVLDKWSYYSENWVKIFSVWEGGLAIWGAIAGGLLALQFLIFNFQFSKKIEILDLVAIGLPLGQTIGRWGNFFNNEIVGKNGEQLFLYESLATFILFLIIYHLRNKKRYKLMGIYLLGYGCIRLILERFRITSDTWLIGTFSVSTALSVISIIIGILWITVATGMTKVIWRRPA